MRIVKRIGALSRKNPKVRTIAAIVSAVAFLYILGVAGAVERNTMSVDTAAVRMVVAFAVFVVSFWFTGAFEDDMCEVDEDADI